MGGQGLGVPTQCGSPPPSTAPSAPLPPSVLVAAGESPSPPSAAPLWPDAPPVLIVPPKPVAPPVASVPLLPPVPPVNAPPPPLPELPADPPPAPKTPPLAVPPDEIAASTAASGKDALVLLLQPLPARGNAEPTIASNQEARPRVITQVSTTTLARATRNDSRASGICDLAHTVDRRNRRCQCLPRGCLPRGANDA